MDPGSANERMGNRVCIFSLSPCGRGTSTLVVPAPKIQVPLQKNSFLLQRSTTHEIIQQKGIDEEDNINNSHYEREC